MTRDRFDNPAYIIVQRLADGVTRYLKSDDSWSYEETEAKRWRSAVKAACHAGRRNIDPFSLVKKERAY